MKNIRIKKKQLPLTHAYKLTPENCGPACMQPY